MPKGKELGDDLDRLIAATLLFARQEWERASFGDEEDYDDARDETHRVVTQVLDALEKNLDEDLLEQLDDGEYPRVASTFTWWPRLRGWRSMWPYWNYYNVFGGRFSIRSVKRGLGRAHDMLDEILDDFRADFEERLKRARREDRSMTDTELDEAVGELKQDLSVVARRARRREDRRDDDDVAPRASRKARESRTA